MQTQTTQAPAASPAAAAFDRLIAHALGIIPFPVLVSDCPVVKTHYCFEGPTTRDDEEFAL